MTCRIYRNDHLMPLPFGYIRMISGLCLGLLLCMTGHGKLIQVAPGSDVSESCVGSWSGWDRTGTSATELTLDDTAHFLVQNFQQRDRGLYMCGVQDITLEQKPASSGDATLLYRAVGQSVHLFCKFLGAETCWGNWNWTPHQASNRPEVTQNRGLDGDYSLHISSVGWGHSGVFSCQRQCLGRPLKPTSYELVVVNATVEPQHVYEGGDVTLRCSLSHLTTPVQVCWIHLDPNQCFGRRYRGYSSCRGTNAAAVSHTVSIVSSVQSQWACAVFHGGTLRALLPVQLNVSKHTTTHSPPTHTTPVRRAATLPGTHSESTMVTRDTTATQHTEPSADVEVCEDEDERRTADEEACAGGLSPHRGTVTYASVHLKRKPTEDLSKICSDVASTDPPATAGGTEEEGDPVIYTGLKMNSCR
ncbi:uncharacterized protein LOC121709068 isoform X2 [Alosa sapidissima]|uniref:uncharacterized protein LOC121709068 isoform X2 n=1 Tax=Alosa sapidissima TaxID=34773 RepID=UPI001C0A125D|nr:uncharacterized protein LOC121709068 isoform X2 [Alosa sapidissima]